MFKYSLLALFALLVLAVGCKSATRAAGGSAAKPVRSAQATPAHDGSPAAGIGAYTVVKLNVKLRGGAGLGHGGGPGQRSPRGGGAGRGGQRGPGGMGPGGMGGHGGGGCPQTETGDILGIVYAQPHGCIVGDVQHKGPAEKAGVKAGDSIVECNGSQVTCPSSLLPTLFNGTKSGLAALVIHRPKKGPGAGGQGPVGGRKDQKRKG